MGAPGRRRGRQPGRPDASVVPGARGRAGGGDAGRPGRHDPRRRGVGWPPAVGRGRRAGAACCGARRSSTSSPAYGNLGHVLFGSGDAGRAGLVRRRPDRGRRAGVPRHVAAARVTADSTPPAQLASVAAVDVFWLALVADRGGGVVRSDGVGWRRAAGRWWRSSPCWPACSTPRCCRGRGSATRSATTAGCGRPGRSSLCSLFSPCGRWAEVATRSRTAGLRRACSGVGRCGAVSSSAVANLPRSVQHTGADQYLAEQRSVASCSASSTPSSTTVAVGGPVVVDDSAMYFGHGYTYPLLIELQEHGVEFRFDDAFQERRFGSRTGQRRHRDATVCGWSAGDQALALRDRPRRARLRRRRPTGRPRARVQVTRPRV